MLDFGIMVPENDNLSVTGLLHRSREGDREAFDRLLPLVYGQLRRLANHILQSERRDHTLPATALVHEAYVRMVSGDAPWQDRVHFYSVAARIMRHILVDYARNHRRQKRGGGAEHVSLDEALVVSPEISVDLISLDMAMQKLAQMDQRKCDIIELMFFAGVTTDEAAQALGISPATLFRELKLAKAFLYRELSPVEA